MFKALGILVGCYTQTPGQAWTGVAIYAGLSASPC